MKDMTTRQIIIRGIIARRIRALQRNSQPRESRRRRFARESRVTNGPALSLRTPRLPV